MAEQKTGNREKVKEIVAGIESGIKDLFQSDRYAEYLRTMSRFHNYSYRNTLLIHSQRPDATLVAGFTKWKNQFQRHVKKGERGSRSWTRIPTLRSGMKMGIFSRRKGPWKFPCSGL